MGHAAEYSEMVAVLGDRFKIGGKLIPSAVIAGGRKEFIGQDSEVIAYREEPARHLRFRRTGESGDHRVEHRQAERNTGATQKSTP